MVSEHDELEPLSGEWRCIPDKVPLNVPAALRRKERQELLFVLELLGCALMVAVALFFWLGGDGPVYRVASALFVASAVLTGIFAAKTRAGFSRWTDWTPEGVLAFRLRECEVALLGAKWQLGSSVVLVVFAAFVWFAAELGWDALPQGFHRLYAAVVAVTVLVVVAWAVWRIRTKRAERMRLHALLEELGDG